MFQWRGPAPYFFVATPAHVDDFLHAHLGELTYGWGGIPAQVYVGTTEVTTSLMPKDGVYLVPLKVALRSFRTHRRRGRNSGTSARRPAERRWSTRRCPDDYLCHRRAGGH